MSVFLDFLTTKVTVCCKNHAECKRFLEFLNREEVYFKNGAQKRISEQLETVCKSGAKPVFTCIEGDLYFTPKNDDTISLDEFVRRFNEKPYYYTVNGVAEFVDSDQKYNLSCSAIGFDSVDKLKKQMFKNIVDEVKTFHSHDIISYIYGDYTIAKDTFENGDEYVDSDDFVFEREGIYDKS